jgi:hypothetical protein
MLLLKLLVASPLPVSIAARLLSLLFAEESSFALGSAGGEPATRVLGLNGNIEGAGKPNVVEDGRDTDLDVVQLVVELVVELDVVALLAAFATAGCWLGETTILRLLIVARKILYFEILFQCIDHYVS